MRVLFVGGPNDGMWWERFAGGDRIRAVWPPRDTHYLCEYKEYIYRVQEFRGEVESFFLGVGEEKSLDDVLRALVEAYATVARERRVRDEGSSV